jgi:Sec-independent protein translocase protein TatA
MKKMLAVILIVLFGTVGLAYGQAAKDAIKAVKKLEAKVESGTSYKKYREDLGDANAEVKLFLESKAAKKDPALAQSLKKIMENYQDAANLWKTIADHPARAPYFQPDEKLTPTSEEQWHVNLVETSQRMFKKYPKAYDKLRVQRTSTFMGKTSSFPKEISLNEFLSVIWTEASNEVKKLSLD